MTSIEILRFYAELTEGNWYQCSFIFLLLCFSDITLSSLHSHFAHRTSANMVLGPAGPSSGFRSHLQDERHHRSEFHPDRNDLDDERRLRGQPKAKRKRRRNMITANLSGTRYEVSKYVLALFLFKTRIFEKFGLLVCTIFCLKQRQCQVSKPVSCLL